MVYLNQFEVTRLLHTSRYEQLRDYASEDIPLPTAGEVSGKEISDHVGDIDLGDIKSRFGLRTERDAMLLAVEVALMNMSDAYTSTLSERPEDPLELLIDFYRQKFGIDVRGLSEYFSQSEKDGYAKGNPPKEKKFRDVYDLFHGNPVDSGRGIGPMPDEIRRIIQGN